MFPVIATYLFLNASCSEARASRDHFLFTFFYWTFVNCGIAWWVPVSSLKLSSNGLRYGMYLIRGMYLILFCFCRQTFINSNVLLVSLMELQLKHIDLNTIWLCFSLVLAWYVSTWLVLRGCVLNKFYHFNNLVLSVFFILRIFIFLTFSEKKDHFLMKILRIRIKFWEKEF